MFADVSTLRYWKSERADLTTCEDAARASIQRGLFCVADGAGTTLFSNIWADILVEHFLANPLVGIDPFEMEWWIRQAQKRYRARAPQIDTLNWNARQKASEQGAYATLASLRVLHADAQTATFELLAIGDSCILIGGPTPEKLRTFPLLSPTDFDRAPYCVPALLKNLHRNTLYAKQREVTLAPGDTLILATDAVAHWIMSGGESGQEAQAWHAFQEIASKHSAEEWSTFIDHCRAQRSMIDDDSTALIIRLRADAQDGEPLGQDNAPAREIIEERQAEFAQARAENNKELLAILYGDGRMLQNVGVALSDEEKARNRAVADAMREVLQAMREAIKAPNFVARIEPLWWQYAALLEHEPCAETIRKTLTNQGVRLHPPSAQPQPQAAPPVTFPQVQPVQPSPVHAHPQGEQFRPLAGSEPELARSLVPVLSAQERAALDAFRAALQRRDDEAIVRTFQPAFALELREDEKLRLENARLRFRDQLRERLRLAIDRDLDDEILDTAQAIYTSPVPIIPSESEQKRIQRANEHKKALDHLQRVLQEGTYYEKVKAWQALEPYPPTLSPDQQAQLELARNLVEALHANNGAQICQAYDTLEYSPLRKHFINIPLEDQQRIRAAQQSRTAVQQLRALLQSKQKNVYVLVDTYRRIPAPQSFLSPEEQRLLEVAQAYISASANDEQTLHRQARSRVQDYDELFFSPYHFTFSPEEVRQLEAERVLLQQQRPPIARVNQTILDITQFLALYLVTPLYASLQIGFYSKELNDARTDIQKQQAKEAIDYWKQNTTPFSLPQKVLATLIDQALMEQGLNEMPEKQRRSLEKELQKTQESFFKDIRAQISKVESTSLIPLSEQYYRGALLPYAQHHTFVQHLQTASGLSIDYWLKEQRRTATLLYYQRPDVQAPTTLQQHESWLAKWWFLSQTSLAAPGGLAYA